MNIFISNDDGIYAPGLLALVERLKSEHKLFVVAPDAEQSGCSHSISLEKTLIAEKAEHVVYEGVYAYALNGRPADCVKVGLQGMVPEKIDLVLTGINLGANVGTDIMYSGTANAAREACVGGFPAISLSQVVDFDEESFQMHFAAAADMVAEMIADLDIDSLQGYFLNINFPKTQRSNIQGIRVCEQGVCTYSIAYHDTEKGYFWDYIQRMETTFNEEHDTDVKWIANNYVTVTPLTWNNTAKEVLEETKCKIKDLKLHF